MFVICKYSPTRYCLDVIYVTFFKANYTFFWSELSFLNYSSAKMVQNAIHVSKSDCQEVLENYYKTENVPKILSFSTSPVSEDVNGFMGEHLFLKIKVENESRQEELQFFAKTVPAGEDRHVEFVKSADMFYKEVACYKFLEEIRRECPTFDHECVPKYYYSREEVIILEDLSLSGYKLWDGPLELDLKHIKLSLKALAKFHSASFILEEIKSKRLGRTYRLIEDYEEALQENLYKSNEDYLGFCYMNAGLNGLFTLKPLFGSDVMSPSEFKEKASALNKQIFKDFEPSSQFRNVWCHGDLWTKNVIFQYKNGAPINCKVLDFQLHRYAPPAHDVLFMIYQTADRRMRQRSFDDLVNYYYACLSHEMEKAGFKIENVLNEDEYHNSIKTLFPTVKLVKAIFKTLTAVSQDCLRKVTSDRELYTKVSFRDRTEFVLDAFKTQNNYRNVLIPLMEDVEDVLTHEMISIEECYEILKQKLGTTDYDLLQYELTPSSEKVDFLELSLLKIKLLSNNRNITFSFKVKSLPNEDSSKIIKQQNMFFKEMKLHTRIIPKMLQNNINSIKQCVLKCFLARLNDVMVFDDYSLEGYAKLESKPVQDYKTIVAIVKQLAKLHASTLILEEKLSSSRQKYRLGNNFSKELSETLYVTSDFSNIIVNVLITGIISFVDLFNLRNSSINSDQFKRTVANIFYRIFEDVKPSLKYRNAVCHGHLCADDILFKIDNSSPSSDCLFVNFEFARYNPPAHDLLSFLYLSTDRAFRKQYATEILHLYYLELSNEFMSHELNINDVLPYEEFLQSCDSLRGYAIANSIIHCFGPVLSLNQSKDLFLNLHSSSKFYDDDNMPATLVNACAEDHVLKTKIEEYVIDINELCEQLN